MVASDSDAGVDPRIKPGALALDYFARMFAWAARHPASQYANSTAAVDCCGWCQYRISGKLPIAEPVQDISQANFDFD